MTTPEKFQIEQRVQIDFSYQGVPPRVFAKQYDNNMRVVAVDLYNGGSDYTIPDGYAVNVRLDKKDGHHVYNPALFGSGNTIFIILTQQMLTFPGELMAEIEVVSAENVLKSGVLIIDCDPSVIPNAAIVSTDEYKTVQELAAQVAKDAAQVSSDMVTVESVAQILEDNKETIEKMPDTLQAVQQFANEAEIAAAAAAESAEKLEQVYTKTESDERYPLKTDVEADLADRYTKAEADGKFADSNNVYSRNEADKRFSEYVLKVDGDANISVTWSDTTAQLGVANLDTGSAFVVGKDYTVYKLDDGSYIISLDGDKSDLQKIGGFHYGTCRRVNAALQPINTADEVRGNGWESNVYSGIVPRSVWDQGHRPTCDPRGMVYLGSGVWVDIYQSSDNGAGGLTSAYNAVPLTGTEGLCWYGFMERALVVGKRLLTYGEFCQMAFGSPGGFDDSNTNAWTAKTNTGRQKTGYVANAVSSIGCRDAVGNVWEWTGSLVTRAEHTNISGSGTFSASEGVRAGKSYTDGNGHYNATKDGTWNFDTVSPFGDGYGNIYEYNDYSLVPLLGGGQWSAGVQGGACTVCMQFCAWNTREYIGARCACDSL